MVQKKLKLLLKRSLFWGLILLFALAACEKQKKRVSIGFVGPLSGRGADLGNAGLEGVLLATEKMNSEGGIQGHLFDIEVEDDKQDQHQAKKAVQLLVDKKVVAIIGHMTSSMSLIGSKVATRNRVLMIAPTTDTNALAGLDDYFIRVHPVGAKSASHLAQHIAKILGFKKIQAVLDFSNQGHTENFFKHFKLEFERLGGKALEPITFYTGPKVVFSKMANEINARHPEGVLLLTHALDAALIAQHLKRINADIQLFGSEWPMTKEILEYGGEAVEGMSYATNYNHHFTDKNFERFKNSYFKRFGKQPGFASAQGYDAAMVLFEAIKKGGVGGDLKKAVLSIKTFPVLQGQLELDANGDAERRFFMQKVKKGAFVTLY